MSTDNHIMPENDPKVNGENASQGQLDEEALKILDVIRKWDVEGPSGWITFKNPRIPPLYLARVFRAIADLIEHGVIGFESARFMFLEPKAKTRLPYREYLASPEWKAKAEAAKERAGHRCQGCNVPREEATLEAHHRTYERLGREETGDITVLCRRCHQAIHESGGLAR